MDANRNGNFTSSKIAELFSEPTAKAAKEGAIFGKAALTYIKQKNFERKLKRSINTESNARPLSWGKCVEKHVFDQLGIRYRECSQESIKHDTVDYWYGSPDCTRDDDGILTVGDIKCPQTLNSFCELAECKTIDEVRENHTEGDTYYWQLISNAILTSAKYAELIVYCPYYNELNEIRAKAQRLYEEGESAYFWIAKGSDIELPYLLESGGYNNLNVVRWEVTQESKDQLTQRVLQAGNLLIK